jgi:crotonobetainyl-CoA:carnitine CoA-transferase CaiB-like acyl-CoA transferase
MNPYRTADGRWLFITGLEAGRHIGAVLRALDRTDLLDDPRFADAATLRSNRVEVIAILDAIVAERSFDEWIERFDAEGVWWAPAQTPAEVVHDPQLLENDGLVEVDGGALRTVNSPFQFSDVRPRPGWVPHLGQHTDEVRAEMRAEAHPPTEH